MAMVTCQQLAEMRERARSSDVPSGCKLTEASTGREVVHESARSDVESLCDSYERVMKMLRFYTKVTDDQLRNPNPENSDRSALSRISASTESILAEFSAGLNTQRNATSTPDAQSNLNSAIAKGE